MMESKVVVVVVVPCRVYHCQHMCFTKRCGEDHLGLLDDWWMFPCWEWWCCLSSHLHQKMFNVPMKVWYVCMYACLCMQACASCVCIQLYVTV